MQTVLITGANGFVGQKLTHELLKKSYTVVGAGLGPLRVPVHHPLFTYHTLDFTDSYQVKETMALYKPSVIVHSGAISKPDECEENKDNAYRINVSGTKHLLDQASLYNSHFIFLSTDFVFSGREGFYKEDDLREPVNYYGTTKLLAEDEVMQYPHPWVIARTVLVYGPSDGCRSNLVTNTAAALKQGKPLRIFNDQVRTPTYVGDLVAGLMAIIQQGAMGIYHLSGEDVRTPFKMAVETAQHLGLDESLITPIKAGDLMEKAQRPLRTGFDISKAKKEWGFQPDLFAEGLRKTFEQLHPSDLI